MLYIQGDSDIICFGIYFFQILSLRRFNGHTAQTIRKL